VLLSQSHSCFDLPSSESEHNRRAGLLPVQGSDQERIVALGSSLGPALEGKRRCGTRRERSSSCNQDRGPERRFSGNCGTPRVGKIASYDNVDKSCSHPENLQRPWLLQGAKIEPATIPPSMGIVSTAVKTGRATRAREPLKNSLIFMVCE
jgi:hypothetical protein